MEPYPVQVAAQLTMQCAKAIQCRNGLSCQCDDCKRRLKESTQQGVKESTEEPGKSHESQPRDEM